MRETPASLLKKMLKLVARYRLNYLTRDVRSLVHNMLRQYKHEVFQRSLHQFNYAIQSNPLGVGLLKKTDQKFLKLNTTKLLLLKFVSRVKQKWE